MRAAAWRQAMIDPLKHFGPCTIRRRPRRRSGHAEASSRSVASDRQMSLQRREGACGDVQDHHVAGPGETPPQLGRHGEGSPSGPHARRVLSGALARLTRSSTRHARGAEALHPRGSDGAVCQGPVRDARRVLSGALARLTRSSTRHARGAEALHPRGSDGAVCQGLCAREAKVRVRQGDLHGGEFEGFVQRPVIRDTGACLLRAQTRTRSEVGELSEGRVALESLADAERRTAVHGFS